MLLARHCKENLLRNKLVFISQGGAFQAGKLEQLTHNYFMISKYSPVISQAVFTVLYNQTLECNRNALLL